MKEKEFIEKINKLNLNYLKQDGNILIPVYYGLEDNGDVMLDEEGMFEELEDKLEQIREVLEPKDELTELIKEKVKMIGEEKNKNEK